MTIQNLSAQTSFITKDCSTIRSVETRSLPTSLAATHRGFAFYVASPKSSVPDRDVFYVAHPICSIQLFERIRERAFPL
jgi:hypothetical protein